MHPARCRKVEGAAVRGIWRCRCSLVAAVSLALLCGAACTRSPAPNALIILVDTLRAGRLGAYGNERGLTPFLDSLAKRAVVFRNAYTQSSWTSPSVATLFTSRYPSQHRIVSFRSPLADEEITLAEVLAARGYESGGFSANFLLSPHFGYWQGFSHKQVFPRARGKVDMANPSKARASRVNYAALSWLEQRPSATKPYLLYLHYLEPHIPYAPEQAYLDHVLAGRAAPDRGQVNASMYFGKQTAWTSEQLQAAEDYYDAEIMSVDNAIRELFDALAERHALDNTVVVITADHGEEFQEHHGMGHGRTLHQEVLHIPLLFLLPGQQERIDVDAPVSLVDVAPTILDLLGVAAPASFAGSSLRPLMKPAARGQSAAADGVVFAELLKQVPGSDQLIHQRAVITGATKLIEGEGEAQFYDLATDREERDPDALAAAERTRLRDTLATFDRRFSAAPGQATQAAPDEDTLERMRALGYTD